MDRKKRCVIVLPQSYFLYSIEFSRFDFTYNTIVYDSLDIYIYIYVCVLFKDRNVYLRFEYRNGSIQILGRVETIEIEQDG